MHTWRFIRITDVKEKIILRIIFFNKNCYSFISLIVPNGYYLPDTILGTREIKIINIDRNLAFMRLCSFKILKRAS